ncbi:dihydrofolate reductase family protein [Bradyrhizobium sp.]|uniref:dihydrofolate reductase family protein n=1 Tax=Bradyrhizobium sp. TaxID=376 RepID=UPI0025C5BDB6|nr:dihydrofolate reductase family protein [Bradyrhizobium sp.]MCA3254338.1 dihydrofolate reductase [Alphaproteobacteria bacterium]MCA3571433.1 dihydrofolate reductase [Bradyrhizobium sp.]
MIRGFIAASLDGFVADAGGGVDFLKPFGGVDYGYDTFIAGIGTVVVGRATYDQIPSFGVGWPYPGRTGVVVTSRPLDPVYPDVSAWGGPLAALAATLRESPRDSWVVGGARLQAAFIAEGLLDRLELFVVPVLLGGGIALFPGGLVSPRPLRLSSSETLGGGMVRLDYRFD